MDLPEITAVKKRHEGELLRKKNVVGVGIGFKEVKGQKTGRISLIVMVEQKVPAASLDPRDLVPPDIEGIPTDVKAVGRVGALDSGAR